MPVRPQEAGNSCKWISGIFQTNFVAPSVRRLTVHDLMAVGVKVRSSANRLRHAHRHADVSIRSPDCRQGYAMILPSAQKWDGCYTHTVYYGSDAYDDLAKGIVSLIADAQLKPHRTGAAEFWGYVWPGAQETIKARLDNNKRARALVVHRDAGDWSKDIIPYEWNSLFIASPDFIECPYNCEFFGNDCYQDLHINGNWRQADLRDGALGPHAWKDKDYLYLQTLVPNMFTTSVSSPAIAVTTSAPFGWYDPSNPLTSLQTQLQRFRFVRQRSP
jgi:hypothetical protein